jgi:hypothetical protein
MKTHWRLNRVFLTNPNQYEYSYYFLPLYYSYYYLFTTHITAPADCGHHAGSEVEGSDAQNTAGGGDTDTDLISQLLLLTNLPAGSAAQNTAGGDDTDTDLISQLLLLTNLPAGSAAQNTAGGGDTDTCCY